MLKITIERTKDESGRLRTAVVNLAGEGDDKVILGKAVHESVVARWALAE